MDLLGNKFYEIKKWAMTSKSSQSKYLYYALRNLNWIKFYQLKKCLEFVIKIERGSYVGIRKKQFMRQKFYRKCTEKNSIY